MFSAHFQEFFPQLFVRFPYELVRQFFIVIFRKFKRLSDKDMIEAEGLRLLILHNGNDGNPRFNRHDGSARFERQHIRIRLIPRAFGKNTDFLAVFQAFEGIHNRADVATVTADFYGFQMLAEKSHEPVMHHRFFGNVMNSFPGSARGINDVPYPIMIADINASPVRNFSLAVKPKRQTQPKNRNDDNAQNI